MLASTTSPLARRFTYTSKITSGSSGSRLVASDTNPTVLPSADIAGAWLYPLPSTPVSEVEARTMSSGAAEAGVAKTTTPRHTAVTRSRLCLGAASKSMDPNLGPIP